VRGTAFRYVRRCWTAAIAAALTALAAPAQADAGHAEWVDRDWLHAQLDAGAKRTSVAVTGHVSGHGVDVGHAALGAAEQRRLGHPALIRSLQDDPIASKEFADSGRYQAMPMAPQSIGRLIGVSLRAETSTPSALRLASLPVPAVKTEQHRHSASGFLRAHVEDTAADVVRKVAERAPGDAR
jgi:hypothetical protein